MAITRLGQIGIGVDGYVGFQPKIDRQGQFTRLGQFGVGLDRYPGFLPKTPAVQPEEDFRGFPAVYPAAVEGDAYGVLPSLVGRAFGVVGVVGAASGKLPGLVGEAHGSVGVAGQAFGKLPALSGAAVGEVEEWPSELELALLLLAA